MEEETHIETTVYDDDGEAIGLDREHGIAPPMPETLPPSSDKEYWNDARINQVKKADLAQQHILTLAAMQQHKLMIIGRDFVCISCVYQHTVDLDSNKFTLDHSGNVISLDNTQKVSV